MLIGKYANFINPFAVAEWVMTKRELIENVKQAEKALQEFEASPEVAMEKCYRWITKQASEVIGQNPDHFDVALNIIAAAFRNRAGTRAYLQTVQAQWLELLLPFCVLDTDAFKKAFRAQYKELNIEKETARFRKAIEAARKALEAHITGADALLLDEDHPPAEGTDRLAEMFALEYQQKSRQYLVPVTLHGVRIEKTDVEWQKAYAVLGLDKLPKFVSVGAPIIKRREPVSTPSGIPTEVQ